MNPHQVETQPFSSHLYPVSASGLIPWLSSVPVLYWCVKCQLQCMVTSAAPEYPLQLGFQTLGLQDPPQFSPVNWEQHTARGTTQTYLTSYTSLSSRHTTREGDKNLWQDNCYYALVPTSQSDKFRLPQGTNYVPEMLINFEEAFRTCHIL